MKTDRDSLAVRRWFDLPCFILFARRLIADVVCESQPVDRDAAAGERTDLSASIGCGVRGFGRGEAGRFLSA